MQSNQCIECANYTGQGECEAFPKEIPLEIFTGEVSHTQPYKGDHGIQFEPIEESSNG